MKTKLIISVALLLVIGVTSATAQQYRDRARNERQRIIGGMKSGELNKSEAWRLSREQRDIHRDYRHYKRNDGRISPRERRHLRHEQRKASRHIYWYKHNNRRACY